MSYILKLLRCCCWLLNHHHRRSRRGRWCWLLPASVGVYQEAFGRMDGSSRGKKCKYMRTNYSKLINFCAKRREVARRTKRTPPPPPPAHRRRRRWSPFVRSLLMKEESDYCRKKCSLCNRKFIPFLSTYHRPTLPLSLPPSLWWLADCASLLMLGYCWYSAALLLLLSMSETSRAATTPPPPRTTPSTTADSSSGRGTAIFSHSQPHRFDSASAPSIPTAPLRFVTATPTDRRPELYPPAPAASGTTCGLCRPQSSSGNGRRVRSLVNIPGKQGSGGGWVVGGERVERAVKKLIRKNQH